MDELATGDERARGGTPLRADLRGYGETERPRKPYDVFTLTDDIAALIQALGLERPVIVSHDWDGALSARVAMNSELDAGCAVDLRPLPGVGHFVSLEAPDKLTREIRRLLGLSPG